MIQRKNKVIILPTEDRKVHIWRNKLHGKYGNFESYKKLHYNTEASGLFRDCYDGFHLYFLSDDEIKENDWVITPMMCFKPEKVQYIEQHQNNPYSIETRYHLTDGSYFSIEGKQYIKIIATTDSSLNLPRPLDFFNKEYCEVGGIDEVMVEYEEYGYCKTCNSQGIRHCNFPEECNNWIKIYKPKVAPDNTITIHKIKDSWSREEVIVLCKEVYWRSNSQHNKIHSLEDWIEENL